MPYLQIYINCLRKLLTPLYTPSTEHTRTAALASPPKAVLPALPQEAAHDPRKQPRLTMPAVSTPSAMVLQASTPLVQQPPLAAQTSTHPISNKHLESQSTPTSSTPALLPQAAPPAPTQLTTSKNHVGNGSRSKTKSPTGAQSDGNNLTMKANIQTRPASISQRHNDTRIQHPTGHQGELRRPWQQHPAGAKTSGPCCQPAPQQRHQYQGQGHHQHSSEKRCNSYSLGFQSWFDCTHQLLVSTMTLLFLWSLQMTGIWGPFSVLLLILACY